jgi:hypothetical protein
MAPRGLLSNSKRIRASKVVVPGVALSCAPTQHTGLELSLGIAAALSLLFQVGHFADHAFQFAVWIPCDLSNICGRDTPWISPWVETGSLRLGAALLGTSQ